MKKEESIPILVKFFEEGDPNMRQYCIKGLSNFPNNDEAKEVILQGIRDKYEAHHNVEISDEPDYAFIYPLGNPFKYTKYKGYRY